MHKLTSGRGFGATAMALSICLGAYQPSFGTRLGELQHELGLDVLAIGLAPAAFALGQLVAVVVTSARAARSDIWPLHLGGTMAALAALVVAAPRHPLALVLLWGVAGAGCGMLDPGRLRSGRLLSCHLLGTCAGALVSALAVAHNVGVAQHFQALALVTLLAWAVLAALVPVAQPAPVVEQMPWGIRRATDVMVGLFAAAATIPAALLLAWAPALLAELDAPRGLLAGGLVTFAAAQAVGGMGGAGYSRRHGTDLLAAGGCFLALCGASSLPLLRIGLLRSPAGLAVALLLGVLAFLGVGCGAVTAAAHRWATGTGAGELAAVYRHAIQALALLLVGLLGRSIGVPTVLACAIPICAVAQFWLWVRLREVIPDRV